MRTRNSIKNIFYKVLLNLATILIGLVAQSIFIRELGNEFNGLKSLFTSIVTILSLSELGFGLAIICNLYKPVADNDIESIKSLVQYDKKIYRITAFLIFGLGILLMPFLSILVGEITISVDLRFIFLLYILDSSFSYLLTYKRSILLASQKDYLISKVNIIYLILVNIVQIAILICTQNFILYLIIRIIFRILENMTISFIVDSKYKFLKEKNVQPLDRETKKDIHKKVKGLIFHKIGDYIVSGTDSLIISMSLGINTLGLYNNYYFITNYVNILFSQMFTSVTASVGNLIVENNREKTEKIYSTMLLANSWIYCFCSVSIFCLIEPFITFWLGADYILPKFTLFIIVLNFYIQGLRRTDNTFKEAAGIFYEDRYLSIVEAIINIIFSFLFLHYFGLAGVFIGTICSTMVLFLYDFPKYVYRFLFHKGYISYIKKHLINLMKTSFAFAITIMFSSLITTNILLLDLFLKALICLIIPNLIYAALSFKSSEFKYLMNMLFSKIIKKWN